MSNVIGLAGLVKTLGSLQNLGVDNQRLAGAIGRTVKDMEERVRSEAPQGATGNLKRGVESGVYKRRPGKPVAGFVRMSYKIAPHAHLVEFGARGGEMPANPFFRRATSGGAEAALDAVAEGLGKAVDDVLK